MPWAPLSDGGIRHLPVCGPLDIDHRVIHAYSRFYALAQTCIRSAPQTVSGSNDVRAHRFEGIPVRTRSDTRRTTQLLAQRISKGKGLGVPACILRGYEGVKQGGGMEERIPPPRVLMSQLMAGGLTPDCCRVPIEPGGLAFSWQAPAALVPFESGRLQRCNSSPPERCLLRRSIPFAPAGWPLNMLRRTAPRKCACSGSNLGRTETM